MTLPEKCSKDQERDQRTAFYSGFFFCLTFMTGPSLTSLSDVDAESTLLLIHNEVTEYFDKLEHGFDTNEVACVGATKN